MKQIKIIILYSQAPLPGMLVPRATKEMAVTLLFRPMVQPKPSATSPIIAVSSPMKHMDTMKQYQPWP